MPTLQNLISSVHMQLEGVVWKSMSMNKAHWEEMELKALFAIQLCISNEILRVVKEHSWCFVTRTESKTWEEVNCVWRVLGLNVELAFVG